MSPNFLKYFILYKFSFEITYAAILTQQNLEGNEIPISFMSSTLKEIELNYPKVDKQAYAIYKAIIHFKYYLYNSQTKVIVPYSIVINVLIQKDLGDKCAHWVTMLQEYDWEIHPIKIVHGQGLCKLET